MNNGEQEEEKTQEKYTQLIPPYPNRFEPDLELEEFPTFTNIELKKPTESELSLRKEESKRLNIIFDDNNNNFSEDKNIKLILSNGLKNSNIYNDVYNIGLTDNFMPSSIVSRNIEEVKKVKTEENNNINSPNKCNNINNLSNDFKNDISTSLKESNEIKQEEKKKKEVYLNNNNNVAIKDNNNISDINTFEINKALKENENNNNDDFDNIFYPNDNNFKEEEFDKNKEILEKDKIENDIKTFNDDYEIEIENENKIFPGINAKKKDASKPRAKNKHKNKKLKNHNNSDITEGENDNKSSVMNQITTLYINGLNSNEYYLGEIIEKGPNFPSTLGIIKYMDLVLFSENYFGEKLEFNEISTKDDFQKIIKLVPIGNKQYIFSKNDSPKSDIIHEENDLIILHGKGGQETFYYIMKLTGQINGNSEYTIYKVKNNKNIIRHFKDSIGLNIGERKESFEGNDLVTEGVNYDIVENPDIEYLIMPGQLFLSKYRKLMKKEKEVEEKKKIIEEKKEYNLNFESNFSLLKEKYNKLISEKNLEIENKTKAIKEQKEQINVINTKEKNYNEAIKQIEEEKNKIKKFEDQMKIKMSQIRKRLNESLRKNKELDQDNIKIEKDFDGNNSEINFENEEQFNKSKEKLNELKEKLKILKENIFCCECKEQRKEVIFADCDHLMLCKTCLYKYQEGANKMKARCPLCKKLNKRFFFISYG